MPINREKPWVAQIAHPNYQYSVVSVSFPDSANKQDMLANRMNEMNMENWEVMQLMRASDYSYVDIVARRRLPV